MAVTLFPNKISVQTMGLKTAQLEEIATSSDNPVPVLRVWGIVSEAKTGVSQYGNYTKFWGELAALNLVTGDEARSQALLLPQIAEGVVSSLYNKAAKDGGSAQIGIEISVEENISSKGGVKFRYIVKPLIEYKGEDALAEMAKSLPAPVLLKTLTAKPAKK